MIQLITLMDDLLRKENLDLKLMPYKVLATGVDHGMVQFVQSQSLANVLNDNGSLLEFWWKCDKDERSLDKFCPRPDVMDAYVKSCAGYCVIMYLLGVGDRHLDNLLLSPNGNMPLFYFVSLDQTSFCPSPLNLTTSLKFVEYDRRQHIPCRFWLHSRP